MLVVLINDVMVPILDCHLPPSISTCSRPITVTCMPYSFVFHVGTDSSKQHSRLRRKITRDKSKLVSHIANSQVCEHGGTAAELTDIMNGKFPWNVEIKGKEITTRNARKERN